MNQQPITESVVQVQVREKTNGEPVEGGERKNDNEERYKAKVERI